MTRTDRAQSLFGMIWRLALAGAFVFALAAGGAYAAVHHLVKTDEVTAPDLLTLEITEAVDRASQLGFPIIVEKREATDLLGPGRVLSQRPAPGMTVKSGARIGLTVSAGS